MTKRGGPVARIVHNIKRNKTSLQSIIVALATIVLIVVVAGGVAAAIVLYPQYIQSHMK